MPEVAKRIGSAAPRARVGWERDVKERLRHGYGRVGDGRTLAECAAIFCKGVARKFQGCERTTKAYCGSAALVRTSMDTHDSENQGPEPTAAREPRASMKT